MDILPKIQKTTYRGLVIFCSRQSPTHQTKLGCWFSKLLHAIQCSVRDLLHMTWPEARGTSFTLQEMLLISPEAKHSAGSLSPAWVCLYILVHVRVRVGFLAFFVHPGRHPSGDHQNMTASFSIASSLALPLANYALDTASEQARIILVLLSISNDSMWISHEDCGNVPFLIHLLESDL